MTFKEQLIKYIFIHTHEMEIINLKAKDKEVSDYIQQMDELGCWLMVNEFELNEVNQELSYELCDEFEYINAHWREDGMIFHDCLWKNLEIKSEIKGEVVNG